MKVAIYGRQFDDKYIPHVQKLFDRIWKRGRELFVYEKFYNYLGSRITFQEKTSVFKTHDEIVDDTLFLISIGGDGTFLDATTLVRDSGIPMIGVNTGRLGFLSGISINEIDSAVDAIQNEEYTIEPRTLLKLKTKKELFGKNNFALNELTVHKKDTSSMITIHSYMNGEFLNSYWADGLIIATPTGSTAYSLSCGGPIILPGSNNFEITPIAPHNLNVRPIVLPDNCELKLVIEGREPHFLVSMDSRSESIESTDELIITKNDFNINLLRLKTDNQLKTIRKKLNWGLDSRN